MEVLQVCRFCLCQDEACLIPLEYILDFTLGVQDVATLTGILITERNIRSYFMCLECTTKLKSCINFRQTCLNNDAKFQELYGGESITKEDGALSSLPGKEDDGLTSKKVGEKEICAPTDETIEISDDSSDFDISHLDSILGDSTKEDPKPLDRKEESPTIEFVCANKNKPTANRENSCNCQSCMWTDILMPGWDEDGTDVFSYSANYIPPGEIVYTEPAVKHIDWESLNPSAAAPPSPPPRVPYVRRHGIPKTELPVRRVRRQHLCDYCGIWVTHVPSHMAAHLQNYIHSCPYCNMKAKIKNHLKEHIKTVHMKIAANKCNICGRKFIHRKTYRYHMLSHEGKTFDCPDCSKTFSNAKYLRDHINRLHNAGKVNQKKTAEARVQRKRHRSKTIVEYEEIDSQEGTSVTNATDEVQVFVEQEVIES